MSTPMSTQNPSRLIVLSDLHLAPRSGQCVFKAHSKLVSLINHLTNTASSGSQTWLLLNGDVFDFLQIPGYESLSLPLAPKRVAEILDALDQEPERQNVVSALQRFTQSGNKLSCMPGNHDPELALSSVQAELKQRLGSTIELAPDQDSWRLSVGGCEVLGQHGHHNDPFNAISGSRMLQAQAAGDATVPLPPGSRLVCETINPYRRARDAGGQPRFPFVDSLPSDISVVLALLYLDPRLAAKRLKNALGIAASALVRKARMTAGAKMLSQVAAHADDVQDSWSSELNAYLKVAATNLDRVSRNSLDHQVDAFFAGQESSNVSSLSAGASPTKKLLLLALRESLRATTNVFRSNVADKLATHMISDTRGADVLITGHTHAAKSIPIPDRGVYINTGTWLDQVQPPTDGTIDALREWLLRLQRNSVPLWNRYPVAVVDENGARLNRWNGRDVRPW